MAPARKPVRLLRRAQDDIDDATWAHLQDAGHGVASRFVDALAEAFDLVSRNPRIGSPRYATELQLPGVRCWPLRPWPQVVFYIEREAEVEVFRVLHGARDIPATLVEPETS